MNEIQTLLERRLQQERDLTPLLKQLLKQLNADAEERKKLKEQVNDLAGSVESLKTQLDEDASARKTLNERLDAWNNSGKKWISVADRWWRRAMTLNNTVKDFSTRVSELDTELSKLRER